MPGRVVVDKYQEIIEYPWGHASLEINGQQFETQTNITLQTDTYVAHGTKTFNAIPYGYSGGYGTLKRVDLGIIFQTKTDNGDAQELWKVQGRELVNISIYNPVNTDKAWVDLCAEQTQVRAFNTAWMENSIQGRALIQTNFAKYPFQIRLMCQANTNSVVEVRMKNSSYTRYAYTADY